MKVLVDTNVLLDVGLPRAGFFAESDAVLKWCAAHPGDGFIAWHSLSNVYYLLEKENGDEPAREFLAILLDLFEVPAAGTAEAKAALRLGMGDFEDALQVAAALAVGADIIVTRDAADYGNSLVPTRLPGQFLASLSA